MKRASKKRVPLLGIGIVLLLTFMLAGTSTADHLSNGLMARWSFDTSADPTPDDSGHGNDGTFVGNAGYQGGTDIAPVPGNVDALALDGVGAYVRAPYTISSNTATTIDAWIKPSDVHSSTIVKIGDKRTLFLAGTSGNTTADIYFGGTTSSLASANQGVYAMGIIPLGAWTHVGGTWDGTTARIYINGVLQDENSTAIGNEANAFPDTSIGYGIVGYGYFSGLIDEVEIYNRALSECEIRDLAGNPCVATVLIDIKPGSFPNSINPRSRGRIPVGILTTGTFDATTVDPNTVRFGATGTEAAPVHFALEDVNGDGDTDLILQFNTQATGIVCGETSASLTGQTFGGQAVEGSDSIRTVPCK